MIAISGIFILLAGAIALIVLMAIITKRPGIGAIVGVMLLLSIGSVLAALLVTRTVSRSHSIHVDSIPTTQFVELSTHGGGMSNSSNMSFHADFSMIKLIAVCVVAIVIAMAVASKGKHTNPRQRRSHWWPVMLLLALIAVPVLIVGSFVGYRAVGPPPIAQFDSLHHDFGDHFDFGKQQRAIAQAQVEAQRQMARAQAEVMRAQQQVAEQSRKNFNMAEAKRVVEHASAEAISALPWAQFASIDINQLIEMYEKRKIIELSPASTEAEAPPVPPVPSIAPPNPAPPIAALVVANAAEVETSGVAVEAEASRAPVDAVPADEGSADKSTEEESNKSDDDAAKVAVKEAEVGEKDSDAAKTASTAVDAEPGDDQSQSGTSDPSLQSATRAPESKPLPAWVGDEPGMVGPDWREVVVTDEYATTDECRQAMDILLMLKTAERIQTLAGHNYVDHSRPSLAFDRDMILADGRPIVVRGELMFSGDERLVLLRRMGVRFDEIRRSVVREEHLASRDSRRAFDTMYRKYTLVQFTPWFDGQLRRHWDSYLRQERFEMVGAGAGSVIGLLGLVFGLLKIDTWTKGYYSKRLFIGVPAAIIGGIVLLSLV